MRARARRRQTPLLYNAGAVLLVMVYTVPAVRHPADLRRGGEVRLPPARGGARPRRPAACARSVELFLPGIRRGLLTAVLVVFIPALGSYVIPDIVGGPSSEMIGNKIAQRIFVDRNLPHASGLSALLTLAVLLPLIAVLALQPDSAGGARRDRGGRMKRSRFPLAVTTGLVLVFFYLPIVSWSSNSFNASRFGGALGGLHARLVPPAVRASARSGRRCATR